ncbi:MAG: c-type cytochrome [Myxococcota bacterium]
MGKFLKILIGVVVATGLALAVGAATLTVLGLPEYDIAIPELEVDHSPEQVARGKRLAGMLCIRCHLSSVSRRFEGRTIERVPWRVRTLASANLTGDPDHGLGAWSDGEIAYVLRTGVHPKKKRLLVPIMPRWPRLATDDLEAIVAFLKSDDPLVEPSDKARPELKTNLWTKYYAYVDWEPFAFPRAHIPSPSVDDPVAYGEYLVDSVLQCHGCHNAEVAGSETIDARGLPGYLGGGTEFAGIGVKTVTSANLTPHAKALGPWTMGDLRRALIDGFRPDGEVLRWPMRRYAELSESEVEAIYAYLRTVPPLAREAPRQTIRNLGARADSGLHVFQKYGCVHCHGPQGQGLVDMRDVDEKFETDEDLTAFLKNPAESGELIMPSWDGVVAEEDYPALCEISRRLSREQTERLGDAG